VELLVQIPVPNGRTVTDRFYMTNVLSKVKGRPATGLRGLCLIHDNATAQKFIGKDKNGT
jgi:hypothetical protein